jgi:predicted nucleotidyltransferase component of viral defense system
VSYDYRYLQSKYPYELTQLEKVCRISDFIERLSQIPFLSDHLALYGGTALNFIHLSQIQRLSVDIDFNYRHLGESQDWGEIRDKIDGYIKDILRSLGYRDTDIRIEASYPLSRFTIKYRNHLQGQDQFKIETGYMKRIPILESDAYYKFKHIGSGSRLIVKTPQKEELYGNKIVTLLDRATPRDLYDVSSIVDEKQDMNVLRTCSLVESLISFKCPIVDQNPAKIVSTIRYDQRIKSVTKINHEPSIDETRCKVSSFIKGIIDDFNRDEITCIKNFYKEKQFKPKLLREAKLNPDISNHPGILWALRKSRQRNQHL